MILSPKIRCVMPSLNILLVEDNPPDVLLVQEALRELPDHALRHAETLREAVNVVQEQAFDVVLMDLGLPDSQQLATYSAMRVVAPAMPIVILTGLREEAVAVEALRAGAQDYLVKGESGRHLARSIRYAIERKLMEERLRSFAEELEMRIEDRTRHLVESQDRLRALATELNLADQRHRKRLAADLHDYLQQLLVLGKLKLAEGKRLAHEAPACAEAMEQVDAVLTEALDYTYTLVTELCPPVLRDCGLAAGLKWLGEYMKKHDMAVTVMVSEADGLTLPEEQAMLLFQSVRELLMNSWKHAGTGKATVTMEREAGVLRLAVRDQGKGFERAAAETPTELCSKFGLFSIQERMKALGGSLEIASASGVGTSCMLILPLGERVAE